jgi:hypothetical protein
MNRERFKSGIEMRSFPGLQRLAMKMDLEILATDVNFNEERYLAANPDVAAAVRAGH